MTVETFFASCDSGKCLRNTIKSIRCEKQWKREECWNKYEKNLDKKSIKVQKDKKGNKVKSVKKIKTNYDPEWENVKLRLDQRDTECRLMSILTESELIELQSNAPYFLLVQLDPCHIFGKGSHVEIKYELDNLVKMNRYSHSCLDTCKNPINGKPITNSERQEWWKRISGTQYDKIKKILLGEG